MKNILILYYSCHGATKKMAQQISRGVEQVKGVTTVLRTVPDVSPNTVALDQPVPDKGDPYVSKEDLKRCHGLALGSPTRFGNMAAPLKYFFDTTADLWFAGTLINKPAGFFTSTSSMHGGQETTLLSMMMPLIHHGAMIVGIPYSTPELTQTKTGGTPYGPSHLAGEKSDLDLSHDEKIICQTLGKRLASIVIAMGVP